MRAKSKRNDAIECCMWCASVLLALYALRQAAPAKQIYRGEITFDEALNQVDQDQLDGFLETVVHYYEGNPTRVKVAAKSKKGK